MRILLVHNHYQQYGGEETYFNTLVALLKKNGHTVRTYEKWSKEIISLPQKIAAVVGLFWNPGMEKELANVIATFKPDIAQFQNVYPLITPAAYRVCRRQDVPVVQRISSYRLVCPKGWLFRNNRICEACIAKRFSYPAVMYGCYHGSRLASLFFTLSLFFHRYIFKSFNQVNAFVFPSLFIRDYFVGKKIIPHRKAIVIPTCANPEAPARRNINEGKYFVYAGRLSAEKGIFKLLDAFSQSPEIKLIVIGKDLDGSIAKTYARHQNILFKGFLRKADILLYMKHAEATIMPSLWYDVLPNVLIESYSVSTPVIAPQLGVFPELIEDGKTGRLYNGRDRLHQVLSNFKSTPAMREAVRQAYRRRFLPIRHHARLQATYEQIITDNQ